MPLTFGSPSDLGGHEDRDGHQKDDDIKSNLEAAVDRLQLLVTVPSRNGACHYVPNGAWRVEREDGRLETVIRCSTTLDIRADSR